LVRGAKRLWPINRRRRARDVSGNVERQGALAEKQAALLDHKALVYWIFFAVYLIGSLAVVATMATESVRG
jgi:hypothetical protein